jgi:hypothetical protein
MVIHSEFVMGINQCSMLLTIIALENPWYIVTAVSFMAANMSEAVHCCTNMAWENLSTRKNQFNVPAPEANREKLLSTRKVRDAGQLDKGCLKGITPSHPR